MRKRILSRIGFFLLCIILFIAINSLIINGEGKRVLHNLTTPTINASSAIAIDSSNMQVTYEKDSKTPKSIASLSKVLLVYVVFDQIKNGDLTLDDSFYLSDYGMEIGLNPSLSNVPLSASQDYTVKELVDGVLIASANNCAITLAEGIAGSEDQFIELIKAYLEEWGIEEYQLTSVTGLDPDDISSKELEKNEYNQFSAYDMAMISAKLVKDFPEVLDITKQESVSFSDAYIENYNQLLPNKKYAYKGVDGLKTGTTESARACLISTCVQNEKRIITVVLGAQSDKKRYTDTTKLLDYSFSRINRER